MKSLFSQFLLYFYVYYLCLLHTSTLIGSLKRDLKKIPSILIITAKMLAIIMSTILRMPLINCVLYKYMKSRN